VIQTIQILALVQGVFVLLVLFTRRKDFKPTTFYLLFSALLSIVTFILGDDNSNLFSKNADWFLFDSSLFITFLYLFIKYYHNENSTFDNRDYLFFIPNILYAAIEVREISLTIDSLFLEILELVIELTFVIYLLQIIYAVFSKSKKHWIVYFVTPIVILFLLSFINEILVILEISMLSVDIANALNTYLLLVVAFLFYFIAFKLLQNSDAILPKNKKYKYKNSSLNQSLVTTYKAKLSAAMEEDKLYLNAKLSVQDVADHIGISKQYISEVLNKHGGINFQDFINQYRVEEFIVRLENDQNNQYTLLGIANDVGFNSKSSFNAIFKKMKGLTPTQFKKLLK